jgi:hypothetical protein
MRISRPTLSDYENVLYHLADAAACDMSQVERFCTTRTAFCSPASASFTSCTLTSPRGLLCNLLVICSIIPPFAASPSTSSSLHVTRPTAAQR